MAEKMMKSLSPIKNLIKTNPLSITIDNFQAKINYKVTTVILLVASVLVTTEEYIGEHIKCLSDKGVENKVLNTFCYFTTTFSVIRHTNFTSIHRNDAIYPGVGPRNGFNDSVKHHAYYQWVPFVLFFQAFMFYLPHLIWKHLEGGKMKNFIYSLKLAKFTFSDKQIRIGDEIIPTLSKREAVLKQVRNFFLEGRRLLKTYYYKFLFCESLYVFNLILQIYYTNKFLGGEFYKLGPRVISEKSDEVGILDIVFPKMTKCIFYKYGPSGSIQSHDALCVMAINIINEKIYTFLWFWFLILFLVSSLAILWRIISYFLHAKNNCFNNLVFSFTTPIKLNAWKLYIVNNNCSYTDWLFLRYLSKNMDERLFKDFLESLAKDMDISCSAFTNNHS